jgi:putative membrane protein
MKIATSKTRDHFPLSSKKPFKKTVSKMIVYLFLLPFFAVFIREVIVNMRINYNENVLIGGIIFVILSVAIFAFEYIYQVWYYQTYYYELTENFVVIKKGVIAPKEISIPYERIQDVYVDPDILDRIFGLYDVHLSSATVTSGMEAHIDGLEKSATDGIRSILLETIKNKISVVPKTNNPTQQTNTPNQA